MVSGAAVQSYPEDANGVVGAGRKVMKFIGALTVLEDAEIEAEPCGWHRRGDAPLSDRGGVMGNMASQWSIAALGCRSIHFINGTSHPNESIEPAASRHPFQHELMECGRA